ncbi:MAG: hypothetical protein GY822_10385, partial [Deltaproteobacteria bacterium]|nr:hypothetical protein [Deltaproteobacteria bacterium]
ILDASILDASILDASILDASILDASILDSGQIERDAGAKDAGVVVKDDGFDGGVQFDAGIDGGLDAGVLDAGFDAGVRDAGPPDLACSLDEMCPETWSCVAGGCQPPFSLDAGTAEIRPMLDATRYSLGDGSSKSVDDLAGFDLNGDNVIDSQYGIMLAILGPSLGLGEQALRAIFKKSFCRAGVRLSSSDFSASQRGERMATASCSAKHARTPRGWVGTRIAFIRECRPERRFVAGQ